MSADILVQSPRKLAIFGIQNSIYGKKVFQKRFSYYKNNTIERCSAVIRGMVNTPEAMSSHARGKMWDEEKREWVNEPTMAMIESDPVVDEARKRYLNAAAHRGGQVPTDDAEDYYGLLQVCFNMNTFNLLHVHFTALFYCIFSSIQVYFPARSF